MMKTYNHEKAVEKLKKDVPLLREKYIEIMIKNGKDQLLIIHTVEGMKSFDLITQKLFYNSQIEIEGK